MVSPATRGETELAVLVRDMRPRLEDEVVIYSISSFLYHYHKSAGVCVRVPVPRGPRAGRPVRGGGAGGGGAGGADLRGAAGQGGDPRLPVHLPLQVRCSSYIFIYNYLHISMYTYLHTLPCRRISLEIHSSLDAVGMSK